MLEVVRLILKKDRKQLPCQQVRIYLVVAKQQQEQCLLALRLVMQLLQKIHGYIFQQVQRLVPQQGYGSA